LVIKELVHLETVTTAAKNNYQDDPPTTTEAEKLGVCHIISPPAVGFGRSIIVYVHLDILGYCNGIFYPKNPILCLLYDSFFFQV